MASSPIAQDPTKLLAQAPQPQPSRETQPSADPEPEIHLPDGVTQAVPLTRLQQALSNEEAPKHPKNAKRPHQFQIADSDTGRLALITSDANDRVHVELGTANGLRVTVNDASYTIDAAHAQDFTIATRGGRDEITVDPDVQSRLRLYGGSDDDVIEGGSGNDRIYGGDGHDIVRAGAGDDYVEGNDGDDVIAADGGRDVVYGLDGIDVLDGGSDADYLDGGRGTDTLLGRDGDDAMFGGRGLDILVGGRGADALAGGHDGDTLISGEGQDDLYIQADDTVRPDKADRQVQVDMSRSVGETYRKMSAFALQQQRQGRPQVGTFEVPQDASNAFVKRFESDRDALASIPFGRQLFDRLERSGGTLVVKETTDARGSWTGRPIIDRSRNVISYHRSAINAIDGREAHLVSNHIDVNAVRAEPHHHSPPMVDLGHELVHALHQFEDDRSSGSIDGQDSAKNEELRTSGLRYDHDADPTTPPKADRSGLTEADLRDQLNMPARKRYYIGPVRGDGGER